MIVQNKNAQIVALINAICENKLNIVTNQEQSQNMLSDE